MRRYPIEPKNTPQATGNTAACRPARPEYCFSTPVPFVVGLTGGIGSGKTRVAELFRGQGVDIIDTDQIAHDLTQPGSAAIKPIRQIFGESFFLKDNTLDRSALRKLIFANEHARQQLESILHPLIYQETLCRLPSIQSDYGMLVVPLLLETPGYRKLVRRILVVDCPEALQVSRTMARSKISEKEVRAIMAAQCTRAERLDIADDVITNDSDLHALAKQIAPLHNKYTSLGSFVTD
ncbi:MAG: dephospho-CoA kinase [Nitrosomonas sp.]|nr:dephospho-CoA kinase [Nitrosomonas sp.]